MLKTVILTKFIQLKKFCLIQSNKTFQKIKPNLIIYDSDSHFIKNIVLNRVMNNCKQIFIKFVSN
ncbi:hypothetical protein APS47_17590 [Leptospira kirschneri serovar Mozdok]|nr:hypothetical protein APS47_17590 [Leptospira kirschneri serovar Mozdok]